MHDKRIMIVTGAGSGLGAAMVRRFLRQPDTQVLGIDRDGAALTAMQGDLGARFAAMAGDLTDPLLPAAAIAECDRCFGPVTVLVNTVGAGKSTPLHDTSDESLSFFLEINLKTMFRMSRAALGVMMPQGHGAILNMATAIAMTAYPGQAPYAAAKGGVIALTRQMAVDYGPHGIRVNAIAPGLIETPFTAERIRDGSFDGVIGATPLRRLGRPEDIAASADFLCSGDAAHITGQILAIDGGWSMAKT